MHAWLALTLKQSILLFGRMTQHLLVTYLVGHSYQIYWLPLLGALFLGGLLSEQVVRKVHSSTCLLVGT